MNPDQTYGPDEVAAFLKIRAKKRTGRALDRLGVPYIPMGRQRLFKGAEVLAWLDRQRGPTKVA